MADEKMVPVAPVKGGVGNTRDPPAISWCFTLNNYTEENINELLTLGSKVLVFQEEIGEEKTPHLQGFIQFKTKTRFSALKKINDKIHWEKAKSIKHALEYARKDETRNGRRWEIGIPKKVSLKLIDEKNLFPWQRRLIDLVGTEPDDRSIYWLHDEKGGAGKTSICKLLFKKYDAIYINGGKGSDILHITAEQLNLKPNCNVILFDFPRCLEGSVSYQAIESIKNGLFTSTKYEGGTVCMNPPHVIILANWEPDERKLSQDRWRIIDVAK